MAQESDLVKGGEYNQQAFAGGMNLLADDSRLEQNQYRILFNGRNRYDRLDLIPSSAEDTNAPKGIKQEMLTFGDYEILFVSGKAYYKLFTDTEWTQITGFSMSAAAPRYWTKSIPVTETNYLRIAATDTTTQTANARGQISLINISGAAAGNIPGLLVQDNINQPRFIFIGDDGYPTSRITQTFSEWKIVFTDKNNTTVATNGDCREYVPIGNAMEYTDGVLYIASPDKSKIYQSVTGRPLDFVRNVSNLLVEDPPFTQYGGGDATTTAYSVGVGGISCLRAMSDNSLFVAAGNANFSLSKDKSNIAPMIFGEFSLVRKFLFNAVCVSDRAIFDSIGDTRFIDLAGVRSFNAIQMNQGSEGRNSIFSASIKSAFSILSETNSAVATIIQSPDYSAAILFDDYEIYAVTTVFGPVLAIYDTVNSCWVGFDVDQTGGKRVKQLVKIELTSQALYAITEDDKLYKLYAGPGTDIATLRIIGMCSNLVYAGSNVKIATPRLEIQLRSTRVILNNITHDCYISFTPYVNNRRSEAGTLRKDITFIEPTTPTTGIIALSDVDTQLENILFTTPNCNQGWKVFGLFVWTGGSITQFSCEFNDLTPMNSLNSQTST